MSSEGFLSPLVPLVSERKLVSLLGVDRNELRDLADHAGGLYKSFDRRAVRGKGKWRHIDNPEERLKAVQRAILKQILYSIRWPDAMKGAVPEISTIDNARVHCGQPVVVTLDLKACFPSTTNRMVYYALREYLGCSDTTAGLLTKLTTLRRQVPQGAPTSPAIVNLTLLGLCRDLEKIARERGLLFTIWIDDITISGPDAQNAIEPVVECIQKHGHAISTKKKHIQRRYQRQTVTGVVVNRTPSSAHDRREDIRAQIITLGSMQNPPHRQIQSIMGRISNVKHVCPAQAESLIRLAKKCLPANGVNNPGGRTDEVVDCDCRPEHCRAVLSKSSSKRGGAEHGWHNDVGGEAPGS